MRLTRLTRSDANSALFRGPSVDHSETSFVVLEFPERFRSVLPLELRLRVGSVRGARTRFAFLFPSFASTSSRVPGRLGHVGLTRSEERMAVANRHVQTTSAAHVFNCQRRAPTSRAAAGFAFGQSLSSPADHPLNHGGMAHFGGSERLVVSVLCSHTKQYTDRASDAPSPRLCSRPRGTAPAGLVKVASTSSPRERDQAFPTKSTFR